jgi:hypothetical protein
MDVSQDEYRSQARDLLHQISGPEETQISQQQRTMLYRRAFDLVALGVWADQLHPLHGLATDPELAA